MIEFKRPQLSDQNWITPLFRSSGCRSCEYSFTNLYVWSEAYEGAVALVDGFLVIRIEHNDGSYNWGVGQGDRKALLRRLYQDSLERGCTLNLWGMTQQECRHIEELFPGKFSFHEERDSADYCYHIDRLCTLAGKKLHAKRNHINRFEENHPDWHVETISPENIGQCLTLAHDWERQEAEAGLENWSSQEGQKALYLSIDHYDTLQLDGLILYGDATREQPLAFTMGQWIGGDTYDVIFEKAYGEVQGAYPMINREMSRWVQEHYPQVVYMNREDDLGQENLRKAKQSYYPDLMVDKWMAQLKPGETL